MVLVVANWKMNGNRAFANDFSVALGNFFSKNKTLSSDIELVIAPPFTLLQHMHGVRNNYCLAGQDCFSEQNGAHTGCISAAMLSDIGCEYVIIGHSESRRIFKEKYYNIKKKIDLALQQGLKVILCVGNERRDDEEDVLIECKSLLDCFSKENLFIAYEPIYAIGTGKAASLVDINRVVRALRAEFPEDDCRVLYGGSIKSDNIVEIVSNTEIDGLLIGSASLNINEFMNILHSLCSISNN